MEIKLTPIATVKNSRTIRVKNLDAIEGTPVLDIKPVFKEFQPKGEIRQPDWLKTFFKMMKQCHFCGSIYYSDEISQKIKSMLNNN